MISGIGIDIVEIGKIKKFITNYPGKINSIFTPKELRFCRNNGFKRFSVIFAAKEAVLKSLNTGWEKGRDLLDIEIVPIRGNQFQINLFHRLEKKMRELSIKKLKGSFSSSGDLAIAQVLALR